MGPRVLDGLDQIDWSTIQHAFGPATDVPALLRAVAGPEETARDDALSELFGTIWHQGTVYEATATTVPFLSRLARQSDLRQSDRAMIVALLGAIAAGWSYIEVHESFLRRYSPAGVDEQAKAREIADSVAARAAVGLEAPALFGDLGGVDEKTDWRLAALAGQVPEFASSADVIVERMKGLTDNACLQAALDLTAAMIAGTATSFVVDAAAAHLGNRRAMWADELSGLRPDRRARIVTEALFEDGFDETQVVG